MLPDVSRTALSPCFSTLFQHVPHSLCLLLSPQMCEDPTLPLYLQQMASLTLSSTQPNLHTTEHRFPYGLLLLKSLSWLPTACGMKSCIRHSRPSSPAWPQLPSLHIPQVHMSSLCPVPLEPWLASHSWMKS